VALPIGLRLLQRGRGGQAAEEFSETSMRLQTSGSAGRSRAWEEDTFTGAAAMEPCKEAGPGHRWGPIFIERSRKHA